MPQTQNRLLGLLESDSLDLLSPHLEHVDLKASEGIEEPGKPIKCVYFPEAGLISVVASLPGGRDAEVGLIGREGMTGHGLVLGDSVGTFVSFVQSAGTAWRIDMSVLRQAMEMVPDLRRLALLSVRSFSIQIATTAAGNAQSKIEDRLARWLLMCQDRLGTSFNLTHEFISIMLGVRRSGVTMALQALEGDGLIRSTRGRVEILDRHGLIKASGGAYGLAESEDRRLFGETGADVLAVLRRRSASALS